MRAQLERKAAKKGEITLKWKWNEHHIPETAAKTSQTVSFRITENIRGHEHRRDIHGLGPDCQGLLRWEVVHCYRDIDIVSLTAVDNMALSDPYYVKYLEEPGATKVAT